MTKQIKDISTNQKKQVLYPSFSQRVLSSALDFFLLNIIFNPILRFTNMMLYKFNFKELITEENLAKRIESLSDVAKDVKAQEVKEMIDISEFMPYLIEVIIANYLILGFYFIFFWYKFNATPGKFIMRLRIVKYDDPKAKLTILDLIKRYFGYLTWFISVFTVAFHPQRRAIHDRIAGTVVVKS